MRLRRDGLVLFALLFASPAFGQDTGFNANNFKPTLDPYGYLSLEGARSLRSSQLHAKAVFNWAHNPLEFRRLPDDLITDFSVVDVVAGFGLMEIGNGGIELGVDLPVIVDSFGHRFTDLSQRLEDGDIGDLRVQVKAVLMDREDDAIGLFARGWIEFPTGEVNDFFSNRDSVPTLNVSVGAEKQLGMLRVGVELGWEWIDGAINLGGATIDDKAHVRAGIGLAPFESLRDLEVLVEVQHWFRIADPYRREVEAPVELGCALKYTGTFDLMIGGSGGLNEGVGAPDARVFASAGLTF